LKKSKSRSIWFESREMSYGAFVIKKMMLEFN